MFANVAVHHWNCLKQHVVLSQWITRNYRHVSIQLVFGQLRPCQKNISLLRNFKTVLVY